MCFCNQNSISLKWHILPSSPLFEKHHISPQFKIKITKTLSFNVRKFKLTIFRTFQISKHSILKHQNIKTSSFQTSSIQSIIFKFPLLLLFSSLQILQIENVRRSAFLKISYFKFHFWGSSLLLGRTFFSATLPLGAYCMFVQRQSRKKMRTP